MNSESIHLVCASCLSVNRVPPERIVEEPICGKCRSKLLPASPITLDDRSFDKFIRRSGLPVLVDFWASWCAPCRMMAPAFAEAASELSPNCLLAKVDTDAANATASKFSLPGIPTIILFRGGTEIARETGALDAAQIVRWVETSI